MNDDTRAAIRKLEESGLIRDALAAFRVDVSYCVEMAQAQARAVNLAEGARARAAVRADGAVQSA